MDGTLFEYAVKFGDQLVTHLAKLNPNINWREIIGQYIGLPDEKFIKKIRPLLWTNKDLETPMGWYTTNSQNFYHYAKFLHVLGKYRQIDILDVPDTRIVENGFITSELRAKIRVAESIMKLLGLSVRRVTKPSDRGAELLLTTASILYLPEDYEKIINGYHCVCHDEYFNTYSTEGGDKLCRMLLTLYLLAFDPDVNLSGATHTYEDSVKALTEARYNFVKTSGVKVR